MSIFANIPATAFTLLAAAVLALIIFETTDPTELIILAIVITVALYIIFGK